MAKKPVVGIPASVRRLEFSMQFHGTAYQYLRAVREEVEATVLTIPGLPDIDNALEILEVIDGVLLTGSFSNIHPSAFQEPATSSEGFYDQERDAVTLPQRADAQRPLPCSHWRSSRGVIGTCAVSLLSRESAALVRPGRSQHWRRYRNA